MNAKDRREARRKAKELPLVTAIEVVPEEPAPKPRAGSVPPKTLPPSSMTAPVAHATPAEPKPKTGPIIVDPHDRDGRKNRILEIHRRRQSK